jgi:hypothetical protein
MGRGDLLNHDGAMQLGGATCQCLANRKAFYRHSPSRREKTSRINSENKSVLHRDSSLTLARMKNAAAPTRQHNPGQLARAAPLNGLLAMCAYFDFDCSHRRRTATSEVVGNGMMGDPTPLFFANECAVQGQGARFSPNKTNNSVSRAGVPPPISGGSNRNVSRHTGEAPGEGFCESEFNNQDCEVKRN